MDIYESIYRVHMHTPQPLEPSLPFVTETRRQNIVTIRRLLVVRLDWKTPFSVACWTGISAGSERLPLRLLEGLEASHGTWLRKAEAVAFVVCEAILFLSPSLSNTLA